MIELSIEGMLLGDSRSVSDLVVPAGVAVLDDPETVLLTVAITRVTLEEPTDEEVDELEEGEEPAEGEEAEGAEEGGADDAPSGEEETDS